MSGDTTSHKSSEPTSTSFQFTQIKPVWWLSAGAAFAIALILFLIISIVDPAPPESFRLATGAPGGAYAAGGEAIKARLAGHGIDVELVETTGSMENLNLLTNSESPVEAAILQGGIGLEEPTENELLSLGAFFFEPLFIFVKNGIEVSDLRDLAGFRIAVGAEGSGTDALARLLLEENGLVASDVSFSPEAGEEAALALQNSWVEAAMFVTALDRPYVQALIQDPEITLVSLGRAEAYNRRHRYLAPVTLPEGVLDLADNIPAQDITLLASAASVTIHPDLHPALQELLLEALFAEYASSDILAPPGAFPNAELSAFPLSDEAQRYFERGGPPFLQRYLPFWAANLVDRLWLLVIPLATLMYPLIKIAPPVYRWRIRRRIITWYRDLRLLELEGREAKSPEERARVNAELDRILHEVGDLDVPLSYNDDVYRLRSHIRFVRQILAEMDAGQQGDGNGAAIDAGL